MRRRLVHLRSSVCKESQLTSGGPPFDHEADLDGSVLDGRLTRYKANHELGWTLGELTLGLLRRLLDELRDCVEGEVSRRILDVRLAVGELNACQNTFSAFRNQSKL